MYKNLFLIQLGLFVYVVVVVVFVIFEIFGVVMVFIMEFRFLFLKIKEFMVLMVVDQRSKKIDI